MNKTRFIPVLLLLSQAIVSHSQTITYTYNQVGCRIGHITSTPEPLIVVTPSEMEVAGFTDTAMFEVLNYGEQDLYWSVETNNSWLQIITDTFGVNHDTIRFVFETNINTPRIGTFSVISEDALNSPVIVTINQLGYNSPPIVENPIEDITQTEGFATYNLSIVDVFFDPDSDPLTYSLISSNENAVTAIIVDEEIIFTEVAIGVSTITLTADDGNGNTCDEIFTFSVIEIGNNPPIVENPLPDIQLNPDFILHQINIGNVFSDPDEDDLVYSAVIQDGDIAAVVINSTTLNIIENNSGTTTITIIADDQHGGSASNDFVLTVNSLANNPPIIANSLADVTEYEGFETLSIDFSNVFEDPESDELIYDVTINNTSIATVEISGLNIIITEVGLGDTFVTLTAIDAVDNEVSTTFNLSVLESPNNSPVVNIPIPDTSAYVSQAFIFEIPENSFTDPDEDELFYTASQHNNDPLPDWLYFDASSKTFSGIPTSQSVFIIKVIASDGELSAFDMFVLDVQLSSEISINDLESIIIYPNPSTGLINIDFINDDSNNNMITVTNIMGQVVKEIVVNDETHIEIDLSNQEKGIYFISIISDAEIKVTKIVLQ